MDKVKRKNKSDYGENFTPPDGGWGWLVCFASGFTNICMFPIFQQFGLIFRDKLIELGMSNKEITSIVNTHFAVSSLSGFFNGQVFRTFSYRGVALSASFILITGILMMMYVETFLFYMLVYSLYLAIAKGFIISAKQVAFLTYFRKNRRRALSIIVTLPAIGSIVMPYLVTFLMYQYGIRGTLLIFGGIAMHTLAASLVYQPVQWHTKQQRFLVRKNDPESCIFCGLRKEDEVKLMNSKHSADNFYIYDPDEKFCNCSEIKTLTLKSNAESIHNGSGGGGDSNTHELINADSSSAKIKSYPQRIVSFLDLDLLKDKTFLNICFGMTCTLFVEQNFNTLAPFFLRDFGYSYEQVTFAISISRVPDLLSRIITPYAVQKIKWQNRTFWLICVTGMTFAEIIIARNPSFEYIVTLMFVSGIFRGTKMIFHGMLIPDYVPLKRMPAALGLNRMLGGIVMLSLGPIIGLIRDKSNFQSALMFLNFIAIIPITLWSIEFYCKRNNSRPATPEANVGQHNNNNEDVVDEKNPMIVITK